MIYNVCNLFSVILPSQSFHSACFGRKQLSRFPLFQKNCTKSIDRQFRGQFSPLFHYVFSSRLNQRATWAELLRNARLIPGQLKLRTRNYPPESGRFSSSRNVAWNWQNRTAINWFIGREISRKGLKAHLARSNLRLSSSMAMPAIVAV